MKTYLLTTKTQAYATFKYKDGVLVYYHAQELTLEQLHYLLPRLPILEEHIPTLRKILPRVVITEVLEEVTFDNFFAKYSKYYGERVDKKKAHIIFDRIPGAAQLAAYNFIEAYANRCKRNNIPMKMAKTYLNQEPWND